MTTVEKYKEVKRGKGVRKEIREDYWRKSLIREPTKKNQLKAVYPTVF